MKRVFVVLPALVAMFGGATAVSAGRGDPLDHPSVREVILMVNGGVDYEVIVERVRRMPAVPALDSGAIAGLTSKGVPAKVVFALGQRNEIAGDCEIPEQKIELRTVLDHPSIQELIRMVNAGLATGVIVERAERLQDVPAMDARAISKLTGKAVPDGALLELVRRQEIPPDCATLRTQLLAAGKTRPRSSTARKATATDPANETKRPRSAVAPGPHPRISPSEPAAGSTGLGRIRVVARSSLPVTYLEVFLDGDAVGHKGEMHRGETKPGWTLPPPSVVDIKRDTIVYESEVPAGRHEIWTGFALTRIVETDWDSVVEARGQRYDTTTAGPADENGEVPACELPEGRTCIVRARFHKRGDAYVVTYDSEVR